MVEVYRWGFKHFSNGEGRPFVCGSQFITTRSENECFSRIQPGTAKLSLVM